MQEPQTLNQLFFGALNRYGQRPAAFRVKRDGGWQALDYHDVERRVRALGAGLRALGITPDDRVAILSENRPEWALADFACLTRRSANVPVYPTLPPNQVGYILRDSGAVALFVSSREQLAKVQAVRGDLPALRHIILFDDAAGFDGVQSLAAVEAMGRDDATDWKAEALGVGADDVATIIYTSGTTGDPKGVMLTHGNIASNVVAGLKVLPLQDGDECLSFLPLSHIFERMAGHYVMFHAGAIINYATSVDTVAAEMGEVRPTVVLSVPRLFEKIYGRVLDSAMAGSAIKRRIFFWAKRTGERWVEYYLSDRDVPAPLALQYRLAHKLVFSKLIARVGGRLRFFVSGGAPLNADIARFFFAAGLPVLEGYGLTETSPVIAVNGPGATRLGTVGRPVPGVEVRIAEDGEILTRGPHVMKGYFKRPDATRELIDDDGWLHTGDIGVLDDDGFLRITDRKKDLIVTAGGKNIAPQPIENRVKTNKFVASVVMLGDRRKFPIMLIVPNEENLRAWARQRQLDDRDYGALLAREEVERKMEREVARTLADLADYETPKRLLLLPEDFSIEGGELTPKLSVKRRTVERKFATPIDALYERAERDHHEPGEGSAD